MQILLASLVIEDLRVLRQLFTDEVLLTHIVLDLLHVLFTEVVLDLG